MAESYSLKHLQPAQVDDFKKDGFLVLRGSDLFTTAEIQRLIDLTTEVQNWPETPGKWMMYFETSKIDGTTRILQRIENFFQYHEEFNRLFNSGRILEIVGDLFGEPAVTYKEKINFKFPGAQGFEPHQDHAAGWWRYGHTIHITMLVCVDPCTAENGALEAVRGWHTKGLLGPEFEAVPPAVCEQLNWEMLEMQPGDIVFFDSFVPHRSGPNLTSSSRRVLYSTFNKASEGDYWMQYYADKRKAFPPDCEREPDKEYKYKI